MNNMLKNNIELDVKVKCIEGNTTQAKVAKVVETTPSYVSRIVNGGDRETRNSEHYLAFPNTSSENRQYVPIGWRDASVIPGNEIRILPDATLYHFGVLTSNVHMAWMRSVGGRLKSGYRYSKDIVYNNFSWSSVSEKAKIELQL